MKASALGFSERAVVTMRRILLFSFVFILGACADTGGSAPLPFAPPPDHPFADGAARGYRLLAEYETWRDNDPQAADMFRKKAEDAEANNVPQPDTPDPRLFSSADLTDMNGGRQRLTEARGIVNDADVLSSVLVAEAQVNYDCWLERAAEHADAAQWCRERLFQALDGLHLQEDRKYKIVFPAGDAIPDAGGMAIMREAAAAYAAHPDWRVHITGHGGDAGRQGNKAALLAMRRALAVRNAMAQNGVEMDRMTLGATADTGKGLSSLFGRGDNKDKACRDCANLVLLPAYKDRPDEGPDIKTIAPHYFGSEGQDL